MAMLVQAAQVAKKFWWIFALRGLFAVIFGIIALVAPVTAGLFIVILIGFYFIVDGLTSLMQAFAAKNSGIHWGWWVFQGIIGIIAGILVLTVPPVVTAVILLYLVAFWAIIIGLTLVGAAFTARKAGLSWVFTLILGVLATVYGFILVFGDNAQGILNLLWLVGIWAIVAGITMIGAAFAIRSGAAKLLATQPTVIDAR